MARTQTHGQQILDRSIGTIDLEQNFLNGADWNITNGSGTATITGLKDGANAADAVNKSQLDALAAAIGSPMRYKGLLDVTTPTPDLDALDNLTGDYYVISVGGTYLGKTWHVNDHLIVNKDVAAGTTITAADVDKIDNTESADILRTGDVIDNLTSTDADKPLSANQGKVVNDKVVAMNSARLEPVIGEVLTGSVGSDTLSTLAHTPYNSEIALFIGGQRLMAGSGNDYTVTGTTVTLEYSLWYQHNIVVDYNYIAPLTL